MLSLILLSFFRYWTSNQEAGGTFNAISIGNIYLTVLASKGHYHKIVLAEVLHCPILFTNLISASYLWKKGWYLHEDIEMLNRCDDNFQLVSIPIKNGLYVL